MLYVFHGTDTYKVADQANRLVASLRAKRPDAHVFTFEGVACTEVALDELISAQGLFVEKHVVVLKTPFETVESRDCVIARLERFNASQNIFVLSEGKILAEQRRVLEKYAHKIEEHNKTEVKKMEFNVFALSDALIARDRRALWMGYVEARRKGLVPENIQGTLHWAVKGLLASRDASSAEEAGQKPVVFSRQKRAAQNFTRAELVHLSRSLIEVYHEAHRGRYDLDVALERWCLGV